MKPLTKQWMLDLAEVSDAHRVRESVLIAGYGVFVVYVMHHILNFYFNLPADRQDSLAVAGFCAAAFGVVTGFSAPIFTTFNNSRRQWPAASVTSTVVASTTTNGPTT